MQLPTLRRVCCNGSHQFSRFVFGRYEAVGNGTDKIRRDDLSPMLERWRLTASEIARPPPSSPGSWASQILSKFFLAFEQPDYQTHICCCFGGAATQNASSVSHWPVISLVWELGAVARTSPSFRSTKLITLFFLLSPLPSSFLPPSHKQSQLSLLSVSASTFS